MLCCKGDSALSLSLLECRLPCRRPKVSQNRYRVQDLLQEKGKERGKERQEDKEGDTSSGLAYRDAVVYASMCSAPQTPQCNPPEAVTQRERKEFRTATGFALSLTQGTMEIAMAV